MFANLLRLASFAVLGGLGYASIIAFERQAIWSLEQDAELSAGAWLGYFTAAIPNYEAALASGELSDQQMQNLLASNRALKAFRFKLFNSDGELTFLSDLYNGSDEQKAQAGLQAHNSDAFKVLQQGRAFTKIEDGTEKVDRPDTYAEVYLPVATNGQRLGVVEVYVDVTDSLALAKQSLTRFALIVGALVLAALAVPTLHLAMAWRKIRQTNARLNSTGEALERHIAAEREASAVQSRLAKENRLLGDLNEWLQTSKSQSELFQLVEKFLTRLLPDCSGALYTFSNSRDVLDGCSDWNGGNAIAHIRPDDCWGLRRGRTYEFGADEIAFSCAHIDQEDGVPQLCMPLLAHGETVGLLHLSLKNEESRGFGEQRRLAQACAEQISMAIANVRMRDELQDQSIRDPLTGLFNRRHMMETLRRELANANRESKSVALLSLDVDHFKKFNDTYGHDAGDMVLRAVGDVLDRLFVGDDVACRPGGEEFIVILPDAEVSEALFKAEQIREELGAISLRYGARTLPGITVSIGVALSPADGSIPLELIKSADEALYAAKDNGRNQVMFTRLIECECCESPEVDGVSAVSA